MKTSELRGTALDWAVALADGEDYSNNMPYTMGARLYYSHEGEVREYSPSTDWALMGPIIAGTLLCLAPDPMHGWAARGYMDAVAYYGPTPLIAAARCYVASKLGDEVPVPEELLEF